MAARKVRSIFVHPSERDPAVVEPELVQKCVTLWRQGAKRANSRYGGEKVGNHKGRSAALYAVDNVLREHGITFDKDPWTFGAYERAVRFAAQKGRRKAK